MVGNKNFLDLQDSCDPGKQAKKVDEMEMENLRSVMTENLPEFDGTCKADPN